jgi:4-hydroxybenzoate polyprenyltransferase
MKDAATRTVPASDVGRVSAYARLVKIEHALFSLPMFVSGALVAGREQLPTWLDWLWIVVAGTAARNLALALNRLIDRSIDARNPRTEGRELPAGRLTSFQVTGFILANLAVYAAAAWLIAPICFYLAWIPLVVFVIYPYMKRFTPLCHLGVGAGLALAPLGGYLAAAKSWPIASEAWLLALFTWLWVGGFDIIYAQLDVDSDRRQGIHSLPVRWGQKALRVAGLMHLAALGVLIALWGLHFERGPWLWLPLGAMAILFGLQHGRSDRVEFAAFRVNTLVGFVMLAFVVVGVVV